MEISNNRRLPWLLLAFGALVLTLLMLFTEGQYNDGDSITHYFISRFSFQHPELFLHHWGKPIFTLLSAPFSQLGFYGIEIFNISCALLAGWLSYRVALRLAIPNAPWAILFILFTPVYLVDVPTGLTEPLFSLILISGILLAVNNKNLAAAIVISFLPFARSEGYLMFPLFAAFFIRQRDYTAVLWLTTGFIVYSIIGYFVYGDILWLIHQNPYTSTGNNNIYGHGEFLHFVKEYKEILGIPLGILFLAGLLALVVNLRQDTSLLKDKRTIITVLLIYGSFIVLVAAHSFFWWRGIFGSMGLLRVVAAVTPTQSIICLIGFNALIKLLSFNRWVKIGFALLVAFVVVIPSLNGFIKGAHLHMRPATVQQASQWIRDQGLDKRIIYYSHPFTVVSLGLDPYDHEKSRELIYVTHEAPSRDIQNKSITIWETQFGPNEANIPLDTMMNPAHFRLLKTITGTDTTYKVMIFEKIH